MSLNSYEVATGSPLSIRNLSKRYGGTTVVNGLNLELAPGRCHGLLGPNGAGKTTTLRLALGLIAGDVGEIRLLGQGAGQVALGVAGLELAGQDDGQGGAGDDAELAGLGYGAGEAPAGDADAHAALDDRGR